MHPTSSELLEAYAGRRVLVTGHTGFKGAWLTAWLRKLGAHVTGYALDADTDPALFDTLALAKDCEDVRADIRDYERLLAVVKGAKADYVFHLAAQPLVRRSYEDPLETISTNVQGTAHLLEVVRVARRPCAIVVVTSDKCYENDGSGRPLVETDAMGGHDVYSMSKGATELVVSSYRRSFFDPAKLSAHGVAVASGRAGNVIGGGDWAKDRILPDAIRALSKNEPVPVRNPRATRPWQHVLEPLGGYLLLGARLTRGTDSERAAFCDGWNFGPGPDGSRPVQDVVTTAIGSWGGGKWEDRSDPSAPHEAPALALSIEKARATLGWSPRWGFDETIRRTVAWYRAHHDASQRPTRPLRITDFRLYELDGPPMNESAFACRSCGATETESVSDLGKTPLANALLDESALGKPEDSFPLVLVFCPSCSLTQITETVPPEVLFRNYFYFSSFSETMLTHAAKLVERLLAERKLGKDSLVLEAASNDGYLLKNYVEKGILVLGIEPAENIAKLATEKGIRTTSEFFGAAFAKELAKQGHLADVFHANNVLAHVADLNGFVSGIATVLKPTGVAVIEAPYVGDMIEKLEFDTIYHEHLCYFSLTALDHLFRRNGLSITDVERIAIHGGSLRIFATPVAAKVEPSARFKELREEEEKSGLVRAPYYRDFATRVWALRDTLRAKLAELKKSGKKVAAYGASAKGSTLLNVFGLGSESLDFCVDRSTVKQGHYTPGTHLLITSPERLLEAMPDYVLLLTWNFKDEILRQQAEYRNRGGHFIMPVPEVSIV